MNGVMKLVSMHWGAFSTLNDPEPENSKGFVGSKFFFSFLPLYLLTASMEGLSAECYPSKGTGHVFRYDNHSIVLAKTLREPLAFFKTLVNYTPCNTQSSIVFDLIPS